MCIVELFPREIFRGMNNKKFGICEYFTAVLEPEPERKLRLRAVAVWLTGSVVAKLRQF